MKPKPFMPVIWMLLAWLMTFASPAMSIDISDDPMDSIVKAALPNLMFVLDDSGSMDWEYSVQGTSNAVFDAGGSLLYYLYGNPGDNNYTGTYGDYPDTGEERKYWKARTQMVNRIFYNPEISYVPWPGKDEAGVDMGNAGTTTPRSNPYKASPTFDIRAEFDTVENYLVIDNTAAGAGPATGTWTTQTPASQWGANAHMTITQNGTFTWTVTLPETKSNCYVEVWYPQANTNANVCDYTITHAGGSHTTSIINQRNNSGQWNQIAGPFTFNGATSYTVTVRKNNSMYANATVYADAIRIRYPDISIKRAHYYIWKDTGAEDAIVDNTDPGASFVSGTWTIQTPDQPWGANAHRADSNGARFQWTVDIPENLDGCYVDVWYPRANDNGAFCTYTIEYQGGSYTTGAIDQRSNSRQWFQIAGPLTFGAGACTVTLQRTGNVRVYADAIRIRHAGEAAYLVNFNNDGTRSYYQVSASAVSSGRIVDRSDLTDLTELPEEVRPAYRDDEGNVIAYITDAEDLQNFANWYSYYRKRMHTAKAAVARTIVSMNDVRVGMYTINDGKTNMARFGVKPLWDYITTSEDAEEIIVDNLNSGAVSFNPTPILTGSTSNTTGWKESNAQNEYSGSSYDTRMFNAWFRFTPSITTTQEYDVYVRNSSRDNRDPSARYTIVHAGGTFTTDINQTQNPGQWILMGRFTFNAGTTGYVEVRRDTNNTNTYTCADAVKFAAIPDTTTTYGFDWSIIDDFYKVNASGGTPLRTAFDLVGRYFDVSQASSLTPNNPPWASEEDGGSCQQSFCIVMTDGYYNDSFTMTNQDENQGNPFADTYANTLADIAMKYYKTDLAPAVPNEVPRFSCDQAIHQHLVTYTVAFGLDGTLNSGDGMACTLVNSGATVTWPNPGNSDPAKIDDLYHAAVNGRGAYFSASDPSELVNALLAIMSNISARKASGASVSVQGDELTDGTMIYQTTFRTGEWTGDVRAYKIDRNGTVSETHAWSAAQTMGMLAYDTRAVVTFGPVTGVSAGNGAPFRFANLTDPQKALLGDDTTGPKVVDYLRGRTDNVAEENFRFRQSILGDIVHSSPYLFEKSIYAGANDGMLHVFDKNTGEERFAYVPNLVFSNLASLSDPGYTHKFYVDLTPYARKYVLDGDPRRTLLVGGLGKGGKGYYGLDITDVDTWSSGTSEATVATAALWEYNGVTRNDNDMGYTFSEAWIVKTAAYNDDGYTWSVIFGNGYNSTNGHAVLYVLNAQNGELVKKIDTGVGGDNGLSTPIAVDYDRDGIVDYVYAGDLKGNLWKFNLTVPADGEAGYVATAAPSDYWGSSYGVDTSTLDSDSKNTGAINAWNASADIPKPMFTAEGQWITSKPDVTTLFTCDPRREGFLVLFGTGKYLALSDRLTTDTHTLYGIWDYGDDDDPMEYVGSFDPLTATWSDRAYNRTYTLLEQTEIFAISDTTDATTETTGDTEGEFGVLTAHEIDWSASPDTWGPNSGEGNPDPAVHAGWFFNLPIPKERSFKDAIIRGKIAIFISFVPAESLCSGGGDSILNELNLCTGGRTCKPVMDINEDGKIDSKDQLLIEDEGEDITVPPQRRAYAGLLHAPKIIEAAEELKYFSTSSGTIIKASEAKEGTGIYFWMEF